MNNIDPLQIGPNPGDRPGRLERDAVELGDALRSGGGNPDRHVLVPLPGSGVWVEFEQGDPDYPIWVGCFWGSGAEVPAMARALPPAVPGFTVQTPLQNGLVVSDLPGPTGGIVLRSSTGATLMVNDTGIYIQNGKGASITMIGPTVTVNQGALVVT